MIDLFREPGFWVLAILTICGGITLVSSLVLRRTRRRLLDLVEEMSSEAPLSREDKALLRSETERSYGSELFVAAPFAPFAIFGAVALGAYEGWKKESYDQTVERFDKSADRIYAESIELTEGIDPRRGRLWNHPRRRELHDHVIALETWNHPIAMTWIMCWIILALPFLGLSYLISGTMRPFYANIWEPLRDPVVSILRSVKHHPAS
ncbi:hypothetical protein JYP46_21830 [Nitratireductor aquimarinus]|nr:MULTISPECIES: hypothetical protein [Alphaproteobacteria]MBN7759469.1 hypothetical protein [Nitratireductor aquimarinus]MBY6001758.1 hypothetical protein [Tritonibacter mobilis]MBY6024044.1 hypothetical protein [Nitratireductor sp. DP7N14-4]